MYNFSKKPLKITFIILIILVSYIKLLFFTIKDPLDKTILQDYITKKSFSKVGYIYKSNIVLRNDTNRITLILHSSYQYISNDLKTHLYNWEGPISLVISFEESIPKISIETLCMFNFFDNLYREMEEAREKLSVHFLYTNIVNDYYVFDVKVFKEEVKLYFDNKKNYQKFNYSCKHNDNNNLSTFDKAKRYSNYPINVARNFGRNQSTSKYILIADMNHLFSKNFEKKMIQLGEKIFKKSKKFALTYRIFEISKDISILPDTKELLRKYILEKKAFEFHHYMTAHKIPYLKNWLSYHQEDDHNINYQFITNLSNSQWEPQFVSLRDIPYHDESFFYPVRDNTVLRWEMCYQDYQFVIAHDVFMFHQGIKSTKENEAVQLAKKNIFPWAVEVMNNFEKRMNKTYMNKNNCPKPDKYGFGAGLEIQKYMEYPKIFGF